MTDSRQAQHPRSGRTATHGVGAPGDRWAPNRPRSRWAVFWDRFGLKLAATGLVLGVVTAVVVAITSFFGGFTRTVEVTVAAPRSGLVLDPDAKVKVRGVQIGRVAGIEHTAAGTDLRLALDPGLIDMVPSNARVDIRSTTVFGAKYINFVMPEAPAAEALRPGARLSAEQVTVEFNTLFQHLSDVLGEVEPEKLNATLTALGTALEGRGQTLGQLLSDSNSLLREINPVIPTLQRDLQQTATVTNLYADVSGDLLRTVDNATTTSATLTDSAGDLDTLLANLTGLADTTGGVLRENEPQLATALELLAPTTALLHEYSPALYCTVMGLSKAMPLAEALFGGQNPGVTLNAGFMYGPEPYKYPEDLPKVNATGGPQCAGVLDRVPGSHAQYVVTDTAEVTPYIPETGPMVEINAPKVFQVLFAGLPGVRQP